MEQDGMETAGVTRGLNAVFVLPPDWTRVAPFLSPAFDRIEPGAGGVQLLIVVPDADAAAHLAEAAAPLGRDRAIVPVAATSAGRAARVIRASAPLVLAGDPHTLVGLLKASALKLDQVRQVVLAWPEDLSESDMTAVEALMPELPKDAARTLVTRALTPAVETLVERYARRARRVLPPTPPAGETAKATPMEYLAVHAEGRVGALRRLLDALDPARAVVFARDDASRGHATARLATLGYSDGGTVTVAGALDADVDLLVLFDLPATPEEAASILNGHQAGRIVGLTEPRQVAALRDAAGGVIAPFALPDAAARARTQEERVRDGLRQALAKDNYAREVLTLEPLLAEYDGLEIAAAALRLLETERARAAAAPSHAPAKMKRLFINAGETDGIRAGDLVGAIANLGGLTGRDVGRVELRDRHALVEVPEAVADAIATKLTGVTIKGRQIVARVDQERPRPDRGSRDERGGRGDRGAPGDRGARGERGERGTRGPAMRRPRRGEDRDR